MSGVDRLRLRSSNSAWSSGKRGKDSDLQGAASGNRAAVRLPEEPWFKTFPLPETMAHSGLKKILREGMACGRNTEKSRKRNET